MATIRVRAQANVLGLRYGEVGEVDSDEVEALIQSGKLVVEDDDTPARSTTRRSRSRKDEDTEATEG